MTGKKVSAEQVKVMDIFNAEPLLWLDSKTVANRTNIPGSTVRHLLLTFSKFGLLDRTDTSAGYRYRLSPSAENHNYFLRVKEAAHLLRTAVAF